ncbi:MAG: FecR domain-containing protein [Tannerella sp.]|jgi:ferric-dicitrate binding protein FerR (iron transport regulator)|nr:FecR domain-containing protein [Tannerella sp.]
MDRNILYVFFNGTASRNEEMQVREWLEASAENRRIFLKARKLFDMTVLNVQEDTGRQKAGRRTRTAMFLKEAAKTAAIVALTVIVCYEYFQNHARDEDSAMQTVSVPAGQRVNITLPDGTNVWLNARSSLACPVSFNRNERVITLDGEAYFEVAEDKKRPFVVQTVQGVVEALGTHFNVDAYASDSAFEATLMSGSLRVRLKDDDTSHVLLAPDEKAVLKEGKLQVEHVDDYTRYRWREGLICFSNASFVDIMHDFEKYYDISIRVKNTKVTKYSCTGKFRYTDGIDYALWVLRKDIHFTYRRDDENQIMYIE